MEIRGIPCNDVLSSSIHQYLMNYCHAMNLKFTPDQYTYRFNLVLDTFLRDGATAANAVDIKIQTPKPKWIETVESHDTFRIR